MNEIDLSHLELKIFTEQDASDYCSINNINPLDITCLFLKNNELTDISGIKLFKNLQSLYLNWNKLTDIFDLKDLTELKYLYLFNNELTDISVIQYLNNLINLDIENLQLESDQIQYIKLLKNLKTLWCYNEFKDMSVLNQLNKNINIYTYK